MILDETRGELVAQRRTCEPREVRVRVRAGYQPGTIIARAGEPLRLIFRREDRLACTEEVIFPAFGRCATLPPGEDVAVELLPEEPGVYSFTCGWGMLQGRLVVTESGVVRGADRR